jgi:alkylated DNA nucleotide flippase Atl1
VLVSGFDFKQAIPFIAAIPRGRWSSYRDVAGAAGNPKAHQSAGNHLRDSGGTIENYWRVIHSDGSVAEGFIAHAPGRPNDPVSARDLLASEGVRFDRNGYADAAQRFWYEDWDESSRPVSASEGSMSAAAEEAAVVERDISIIAEVNARRTAKGKPPLTAAQEGETSARLADERARARG